VVRVCCVDKTLRSEHVGELAPPLRLRRVSDEGREGRGHDVGRPVRVNILPDVVTGR
jgi:hypothetical protein